ncbi:hypothetical protein [Sphingomonas sp. CARO-RG-8B-R24-01]|uniref:hypothetical protein n=1 Tax=Sphingomonas sp. CARO-RG-8B-R24-01 TaxID=2914831 RepID=UPI001F58A1B6|nr:hypothetical protein [Sphingomonas sp. CARO-RG-8B-R24-01]
MRPNTLRALRRYHSYIGLFFAPMIIVFAVSGALQTFRLQETNGYGGPPPTWIVWLASVHKDQAPPRAPRAERPKAAAPAIVSEKPERRPVGEAKRPSPLPLKIFVALLSIALAGSTVLGVMIALSNRSARRVSLGLLALGTVVPIVLLWI